MSEETSTLRLYLMRFVFLGNFVFLGLNVWPALLKHVGEWDPVRGAAFSFWGALSLLSGLGLRYPLRMLPLLLLQLLYKTIWLIAVAPSAGRSMSMTNIFIAGVVADLIVIPWPYVFAHYVKEPGDRWR